MGRSKKVKSPLVLLKEELDGYWSLIVRALFHQKCAWCGSTSRLQADHIFSRTMNSTRWVIRNGVCLCYRCHFHRKHYEPMEWALMVLSGRAIKELFDLRLLHHSSIDVGLEKTKEYLLGLLKKVENHEVTYEDVKPA